MVSQCNRCLASAEYAHAHRPTACGYCCGSCTCVGTPKPSMMLCMSSTLKGPPVPSSHTKGRAPSTRRRGGAAVEARGYGKLRGGEAAGRKEGGELAK